VVIVLNATREGNPHSHSKSSEWENNQPANRPAIKYGAEEIYPYIDHIYQQISHCITPSIIQPTTAIQILHSKILWPSKTSTTTTHNAATRAVATHNRLTRSDKAKALIREKLNLSSTSHFFFID